MTFCPNCGEVEKSMFCCQAVSPADKRIRAVETAMWATRFELTTQLPPRVKDLLDIITRDVWDLIRGGGSYGLIAERFDGWLRWLCELPSTTASAVEARLYRITNLIHPQDVDLDEIARRILEDLIGNGTLEVRP